MARRCARAAWGRPPIAATLLINPVAQATLCSMNESRIVLIADNRVRSMPLQESNEPFVDLLAIGNALYVDHSRSEIGNRTPYFASARKSVVERLEYAQEQLPNGFRLLIKECFRPISLQRRFFESCVEELSGSYPDWGPERLQQLASTYVAPPDIAPHSTGGAVDLTLADRHARELDMGTRFNATPFDTDNATYSDAENIPPHTRENRSILERAMRRAGFVNYPTEWWHWSYGDRYWAFHSGSSCAIYGSVEAPRFEAEQSR